MAERIALEGAGPFTFPAVQATRVESGDTITITLRVMNGEGEPVDVHVQIVRDRAATLAGQIKSAVERA
jgi:hypothetical protein